MKLSVIFIGLGAITGLILGRIFSYTPAFLFLGHILDLSLGLILERSRRPIRRARKKSKIRKNL